MELHTSWEETTSAGDCLYFHVKNIKSRQFLHANAIACNEIFIWLMNCYYMDSINKAQIYVPSFLIRGHLYLLALKKDFFVYNNKHQSECNTSVQKRKHVRIRVIYSRNITDAPLISCNQEQQLST